MYDTEKRVELVKKRMYEYRRRKERHRVYHLSALCALLFLSLAGALGTVQIQPMDAAGMYGAILLHEGVGGYVLVAMTAFVLAVVIVTMVIRWKKRNILEVLSVRMLPLSQKTIQATLIILMQKEVLPKGH